MPCKVNFRGIFFINNRAQKSIINDLAKEEGYRSFHLPEDVGGRFSVLTSAGLFPIAIAGIDIRDFMDGALLAEKELTKSSDLSVNSAYLYAASTTPKHTRKRNEMQP